MTFEEGLKRVVDSCNATFKSAETIVSYDDWLERCRDIIDPLREVIQAGEIEIEGTNNINILYLKCEASLPAPGLRKHVGIKQDWPHYPLLYCGQDGQEALPPEENGLAKLHLCYQRGVVGRGFNRPRFTISINLDPSLHLPSGGKPYEYCGYPGYEFNFPGAKMWVCGNAENGMYQLKNEIDTCDLQHSLELHYVYRNEVISGLEFDHELLGTGLLTSFFKDMGYEGLDRLVAAEVSKTCRLPCLLIDSAKPGVIRRIVGEGILA